MEIKRGIIALETLPFSGVARPRREVLHVLTQRTKKAARANLNYLIENGLVDKTKEVEQAARHIKDMQPGGYAMTANDLKIVYESMGHKTYLQIFEHILSDTIPAILNDKPYKRSPGVQALGVILDALELVKSSVATEDEKVAVFIKAMRKTKFEPFKLGAMVDDSIGLKGHNDNSAEILIGVMDAATFARRYLRLANQEEQAEFSEGYYITLPDLHLKVTGSSIN